MPLTTKPPDFDEHEWRTIHNALSMYQGQYGSVRDTDYAKKQRDKIQRLMNKIRDNYICTDTI